MALSAMKMSKSVESTAPTSKSVESTAPTSKSVESTAPTSKSVQSTAAMSKSVQSTAEMSKSVQSTAEMSKSVQSTAEMSKSVQSTAEMSKSVQSTAAMSKSVQSTAAMSKSVQSTAGHQSTADARGVYSLSLTQIKEHADFADYYFKPAPFSLRWIHGFNPKVEVINLNNAGSTNLFYAASNCGVVYNWTINTMKILQGHKHMVTCIASDEVGRWLVTSDTGPENVIIIWDSKDCFPQRTIFNPHQNTKLAKLAISGDAKYLLTVGYAEKATLNWWIWSYGLDQPHASVDIEIPRDSILAMEFNPLNTMQFFLLTKNDVWIGFSYKLIIVERGRTRESDNYKLRLRCPNKKVHSDFGRLTCFTFVKGCSRIIVGTTKGGLLVYGFTIEYRTDVDPNIASNIDNFKFVKVFRIEKFKINVIKNVDRLIVSGNNGGEIHFYDEQMKLIYWVHGFSVDSVRSLSFNISPRSCIILDPKCNTPCPCWEKVVTEVDSETGLIKQKLLKKLIPTDATVAQKPFLVRDFVVVTQREGIAFVDFVIEKLETILDYSTSSALSLTAHPDKPLVCVGYADGTIESVNFLTHKVCYRVDLREVYKIISPPDEDSVTGEPVITFPQLSVMCLKYSPSGAHLACGLDTGQLLFLDPSTIDILTKTPFKDTSYAIKEINYSPDSLTLAFSDAGRTVCVYKFNCDTFKWIFIGKHRGHYKDISAVFFHPHKNPDGEYKLMSLGYDRVMVEYDIGKSADEHLEILSMDRMEQAAIPLCGIVWPTPKEVQEISTEFHTDLPMILVANDEFKYKIVNYRSTMTLATYLGPRYEHPVNRMLLTSRVHTNEEGEEEELEYLVFATRNVIGLQRLPLDGNPWKHTGILGHPNQILQISYRRDLHTLFTIGSKDTCMCQWSANYSAPDHTSVLGGIDLDPYYCLVENGRPGWLFQEVRDLFYYIQILCQGTFSPAMRRVSDYIPIDSLPDLMRALGFFPSEYEVENLLTEAKFKTYKLVPVVEIDFEEFVRLYLNHRPAFGDNYMKVRKAFNNFTTFEQNDQYIDREDFIELLQTFGECFTPELTFYLLSILAGQSFEDRAVMSQDDFSFLPEKIHFMELASSILGVDINMSQQSFAGSCSEAASSADSEEQQEKD